MKGNENCKRRVTCDSYMWLLAFGVCVNSAVILGSVTVGLVSNSNK